MKSTLKKFASKQTEKAFTWANVFAMKMPVVLEEKINETKEENK